MKTRNKNGRTQAAFSSPESREKFLAMIPAITNTMVMRDTAAFFDFLSRQAAANSSKIGCHCYCMGGKFALSFDMQINDKETSWKRNNIHEALKAEAAHG